MVTEKSLRKDLESFKRTVNAHYPLQKMILFGSRATKKHKRDSDVDLLLVSSQFKNLDFIDRGAKMYDYWDIPLPVDFLCYTPEEFSQKKSGLNIIQIAVKEGVEI